MQKHYLVYKALSGGHKYWAQHEVNMPCGAAQWLRADSMISARVRTHWVTAIFDFYSLSNFRSFAINKFVFFVI